ncbi:hypothetical protein GCM10022247_73710 [Allokutzneria multivorans]|uniref:DUF2273 domain-containing protein n=1 Tax=Allokutzneria multivorans TaxID=1142134 RepID=A0ABP7U703_9PSEU
MNTSQIGLLAGLILGAAGAVGGFSAVIISLAVGVLGLVIGRVLDGELDLGELLGRGRDR